MKRRDFIRTSLLATAGLTLISCEDNELIIDDTPGRLTKTNNPKNIIIIGAGISGLVAGFELKRAGHNITILEARDRIGGRVFTVREPFGDGLFAEAGAARIPYNHDITLGYIEYFNLSLSPFYPEGGNYTQLLDGEKSYIEPDVFLEDKPWSTSVKHKEYSKIEFGNDQLPEAFYETLIDHVRLSEPANSVEHINDGVRVVTDNGTTYSGDKVICTLPLPVLDKVSFSPSLSSQKQEAINGGYTYNTATRIMFSSPTRFWKNEGQNGFGKTDWPEEIWHPSWDKENEAGILLSYLRREKAIEADALNDAVKNIQILNRWENVFTGVHNNLTHTYTHSWAKEEWSKAGWPAPTEEEEEALGSSLGLAEGHIHFAGEHTTEYHGWMQGALLSGIRAANEINDGAMT